MRFVRTLCLLLTLGAVPVLAAPDPMEEVQRGYERAQKQDYDAAIKIVTPIAESGHGMAQYFLATLYEGGFGYRPPKLGEARVWLERAAEGGLMLAQASLGDKYYDGRGLPQDYAQAMKWYKLSAAQGFAPPQNTLGEMYELGRGVPADARIAFSYYIKAAEGGLALAQVNVGRMYAMGSGVTKDDEMAVDYFHMAANQKSAAAAIWLGSAYETGSGVKKDLVMAYMWTLIANKHADLRQSPADFASGLGAILDNLKYNMTPEQVAEAEKRAAEWKPEVKK